MIDEQFMAIPEPECSCNHRALLDMNLHDENCAKRVAFERNCMVTHSYYRAGWAAATELANRPTLKDLGPFCDKCGLPSRELVNGVCLTCNPTAGARLNSRG